MSELKKHQASQAETATATAAQQSRQPGGFATVLTRDYYVSELIFEREHARVFSRQWTFAGHVNDIPRAGDYFVHEFAGESVIVVRQSDLSVRAFINACRHRGYRFCSQDRGHVRSFTCPYHQWTYRLDGSLQKAPAMADHEWFEYGDFGLHAVSAEVWAGMIFIWLGTGERPSTLKVVLGEPGEKLMRIGPENIREAYRETLDIAANWKTLLENYLECYHCAGSHPELGIPMDIQATYEATAGWTSEYSLGGGVPLRANLKTVSKDGQLVSSGLGAFNGTPDVPGAFDEGVTIIPTLTRIIFHVDHGVVHTLNPVSVGRVKWTTRWYVHKDAVEGQDYDVEKLTEVWRATNHQDKELCEHTYEGVRSRRFVPGPLNPKSEAAVRPALELYLRLLG